MQNLMPPVDTSDNAFHDGDPTTGQLGTIVTAEWLNNVQGATRDTQAEIIAVLTKAGMQPNPQKKNQLAEAIGLIIGSGNYATSGDLTLGLSKKIDKADIAHQLANDRNKVPSLDLLARELGGKASNQDVDKKYDKTGGAINGLLRIQFDGRGLVFDAPEKDSASYMEFLAGNERIAYLGFGSQGTKSFTFSNTKTDVTLRIEDKVTVNGVPVMLESDRTPVGIFGEFPHRATQLPAKWYSVNGDRFDITSPQGLALKSLPAQLKSDWGISESGGKISLPNIKQSDGRTPFLRPINGTNRVPGAVVRDEMRNLTGGVYFRQRLFASGGGSPEIFWPLGGANDAITTREYSVTAGAIGLPPGAELQKTNTVELNAANQVPTGPEFKPLDIGVTLAIYLGV